MKFYSEKLDRMFNSEHECLMAEEEAARKSKAAELAAKKAKENEEKDAKELSECFKAALEGIKAFEKKSNEFVQKYGHMELNCADEIEDLPFPFLFGKLF